MKMSKNVLVTSTNFLQNLDLFEDLAFLKQLMAKFGLFIFLDLASLGFVAIYVFLVAPSPSQLCHSWKNI